MPRWWRTYACLLLIALSSILHHSNNAAADAVLQGVELEVLRTDVYARQLLQNPGPTCGQQFSLNATKIQSGYYYFGCFREFLTGIQCLTFGSRLKDASGLVLTEGWMTIDRLNLWKGSQNQLTDFVKYVEPSSLTNCTADILGTCNMAGRFPTPAEDTYYCNILFALQGTPDKEAKRNTRIKLGGLDTCTDCLT